MKHWQLFKDAYVLNQCMRYSMKPSIHGESVAAHSYYVCLNLMLLHDDYIFDISNALKMAVVHDLPEVAVSDVNHKIKADFPGVAQALRTAELQYAMGLPVGLSIAFTESLRDDHREAHFVRLADTYSVLQKAEHELSMGNNHFQEVFEGATHRIKVHLEHVREYKRPSK